MWGLVILVGVLTCESIAGNALASGASTADSHVVSAENERAREKFRLGVNAFRAERLEEARQLLSEAWRLRRTYDVAAALAQVENELGHHDRAAELLDFCINNFPPIESDAKFQELRQTFDELVRRVGKIDLTTVPAGTEVRVDDELVGTTPLGVTMYLTAGLHEFVLRVGGTAVRRSLVVQAGALHRVPVEPRQNGAVPNADVTRRSAGSEHGGELGSKSAEDAPALASGTRPTFPYYLGSALIVAGVTTGIAFHVAASHERQRADDLRTRFNVSDCGGVGVTSPELCASLADADAERTFDSNLAIFGYGVAGTAAVATAIYWLWPESDHSPTSQLRSSPSWSIGYAPSQIWIGASGSLP